MERLPRFLAENILIAVLPAVPAAEYVLFLRQFPEFDPRKIIHMIRMGMKERLLTSDMLWYCSGCRSCVLYALRMSVLLI